MDTALLSCVILIQRKMQLQRIMLIQDTLKIVLDLYQIYLAMSIIKVDLKLQQVMTQRMLLAMFLIHGERMNGLLAQRVTFGYKFSVLNGYEYINLHYEVKAIILTEYIIGNCKRVMVVLIGAISINLVMNILVILLLSLVSIILIFMII